VLDADGSVEDSDWEDSDWELTADQYDALRNDIADNGVHLAVIGA